MSMKRSTKLIVVSIVLAAVTGAGLVFCVAVLPVAFQARREAARREQAANSLKQLSAALEQYNKRAAESPAVAIAPEAKLPFDTYSGYYPYKSEPSAAESFLIINEQEQFDKLFGMVMWENAHRLPKDIFKSNIVVAAIKRGNAVVEYKVESVTEANGVVELRYATTSQRSDPVKRAYSLIVSIPKGEYKAIHFVENGKPVKKVEMPVPGTL